MIANPIFLLELEFSSTTSNRSLSETLSCELFFLELLSESLMGMQPKVLLFKPSFDLMILFLSSLIKRTSEKLKAYFNSEKFLFFV
jgi:hypothetical protein